MPLSPLLSYTHPGSASGWHRLLAAAFHLPVLPPSVEPRSPPQLSGIDMTGKTPDNCPFAPVPPSECTLPPSRILSGFSWYNGSIHLTLPREDGFPLEMETRHKPHNPPDFRWAVLYNTWPGAGLPRKIPWHAPYPDILLSVLPDSCKTASPGIFHPAGTPNKSDNHLPDLRTRPENPSTENRNPAPAPGSQRNHVLP